jgi:hypothetical protein
MRVSLPRILVALLLLSTIAVPRAGATTMVPMSLDDLASRSSAIVRATTLSTSVAWNENRVIVTTAHMRVTESLAGNLAPGQEFDVATLGGTINDMTLLVEDAPHFTAGADAVLFLEAGTAAPYHVTELAQGKFDVHRDATGRERISRDDLEGGAFALRGLTPASSDLPMLRLRVRAARLAR